MMTTIAILGFGKVGQTLLSTIEENADFAAKFKVKAIWNRSSTVFEGYTLPPHIKVYQQLDELIEQLENIDLVVECAHPDILKQHAAAILQKSQLFISSPTAFADPDFRDSIFTTTAQYGTATSLAQNLKNCYLPLGASVGIWDVIRLDQNGQLASLEVTMRKDPDAFKISSPAHLAKLAIAKETNEAQIVAADSVPVINALAPQNTNTMAVYALAAASLGFEKCQGRIVADPSLTSHLVELKVVTKGGLTLNMVRDNPAKQGQVTGSATFGSFLSSLYNFQRGIAHNHLIFC